MNRSIDNLRVGGRYADELEDHRQARIAKAREMLENEFIAAVLADEPSRQVSRVKLHTSDSESIELIDLFWHMLFEGGDAPTAHLRRLLHLLARRDSETADVVRQLAQTYADDQVDLLVQRGAL
jgi:hypothetical protein